MAAGKSESDPEAAHAALTRLCLTYWMPLYGFVRSRGFSMHDAQDLTQNFFAFLIERKIYMRVDRQKGKFRSFLLASLKNFLANTYDQTHTLKRGGGQELLPLGEDQVAEAESLYRTRSDARHVPDEDRVFEQNWAETLVSGSLERLSTDYKTEGKEALFDKLRIFLSGSAEPLPAYADLADRLGMEESTLRSHVTRLRALTGMRCAPKCDRLWKPKKKSTGSCVSCCACLPQPKETRTMNGEATIAVCSTCNEPLNGKGECLACLLRTGLEADAQEDAAATPRHSEAATGHVFGDFEIARREDGSLWELGCGAMGVTYRAIDKVLHRTVALKVIEAPSARGDSRAIRERFLREARVAAALRHPNVAGVFQFGASPEIDRCYYAMELVEGETLEALVRRDGPLEVDMALEIAIQVTRALIGAAAQGLIHRDLKPGNIMIARADSGTGEMEVKVIDFGLAKATNAMAETDLTHGGFVGTPSFASPEQFGGAPADARSDIYSLGVTLWYALTGQVPYPGKTIEEIRDRQQRTDLPVEQLTDRKIPTPLIDMLRRTLALDPTDRPASARELLAELEVCRAKLASPKVASPGLPPRKRSAFFTTLAIVVAIPLAFLLLRQKSSVVANAATSAPEKSIAVLPFEDLAKDETNAFFCRRRAG